VTGVFQHPAKSKEGAQVNIGDPLFELSEPELLAESGDLKGVQMIIASKQNDALDKTTLDALLQQNGKLAVIPNIK